MHCPRGNNTFTANGCSTISPRIVHVFSQWCEPPLVSCSRGLEWVTLDAALFAFVGLMCQHVSTRIQYHRQPAEVEEPQ